MTSGGATDPILVTAIDAVVGMDRAGRITAFNPAAEKMFGYPRQEVLGKLLAEVIVPPNLSSARCTALEHYLSTSEARVLGTRVELCALRGDGTTFPVELAIAGVDAGNAQSFTGLIRDISKRKAERLEEMEVRGKSHELEEENRRMHEANRLKSEFLANMSHELRTPLNAIIGFAELMFEGKVGPVADDHKEYLGDILNSSRELLKLINGVLDLAKVESGKMEFHPESVDVGKVTAEVCDILRGLVSTKRIRIETTVDASIAAAVLDPSKLKQVLYNYLSNALKFTPDGGLVTIRVVPEEADFLRIEVEDTGIGIRSEDTHRLFVEFQQLDAGSAKRYAGTGLGLALTKRIVEAQGGAVGVRSELGKGSTFWAVLPRKPGAVQVVSTSHSPALSTPAATATTVLVVDDDPAALRLIGAMLKAVGHSALCFADPAEALRAVEKTVPAVVVLDRVMPEIDGYDLIDRLRAVPHMRGVPVVIWTVKDLSENERKRLLGAAQGIVQKGHGRTDTILDALKPYLGANLPGDAHAG
jgi:PAS domain S-box-containing protein